MVQTDSSVVIFADLIAERTQVISFRTVSESSMCWASQRFCFTLMVLTIADVTDLSARTFLAVLRSISKTLASAALTEAILGADSR